MASAQKCGGVQQNITTNSTIGAHAERVGDGGPADEHRHRAGGAADDDVVRARALEPDRVDADVERRGAEGEDGRQEVGAPPQDGEGGDLEDEGEDEGVARAR